MFTWFLVKEDKRKPEKKKKMFSWFLVEEDKEKPEEEEEDVYLVLG